MQKPSPLLKYVRPSTLLATLAVLASSMVLILTDIAVRTFAILNLESILFHLREQMTGDMRAVLARSFMEHTYLPYAVLLTVACYAGQVLHESRSEGGPGRRYAWGKSALAGLLLLGCLSYPAAEVGLGTYVSGRAFPSSFFEDEYVPPQGRAVSFPSGKRNLVYLVLESMEASFGDPAAGGLMGRDLTPALTRIVRENASFGGMDELAGAQWTVSALVAQTAGVPLTIGDNKDIPLPGVLAIGEILEDNGYSNSLIVGSDAAFGGRRAYFEAHGGYRVTDRADMLASGRIGEYVWWGADDRSLYAEARDELGRLSADPSVPFSLTLLTVDTHFPGGYACSLCPTSSPEPFDNVLACADAQAAGFLEWLASQPYYEDTTVVVVGDHLSMDAAYFEGVPREDRRLYMAILNPAPSAGEARPRGFSSFDMYPTTLAALGAIVEGDRLGLGANLFSGEPTLVEEHGAEHADRELRKRSDYFYEAILGK